MPAAVLSHSVLSPKSGTTGVATRAVSQSHRNIHRRHGNVACSDVSQQRCQACHQHVTRDTHSTLGAADIMASLYSNHSGLPGGLIVLETLARVNPKGLLPAASGTAWYQLAWMSGQWPSKP
jgi:hypothetical protein